MKKNIFKILLLTTVSLLQVNCQNDEICPEAVPDTPQLIIRFFDTENPLESKAVNSLKIFGEGIELPLPEVNQVTTDSIAIPLRGFEEETTFIMITDSALDEEGVETGNIDVLTFDYITKEVFISRPCGFVTNFESLLDFLAVDDDNWIDGVTILNSSIVNENETHVQIFH